MQENELTLKPIRNFIEKYADLIAIIGTIFLMLAALYYYKNVESCVSFYEEYIKSCQCLIKNVS